MGIERNTWLARTSEVKNKLDNEQELTMCSQPRSLLKKFGCFWRARPLPWKGLQATEQASRVRGERITLQRGAKLRSASDLRTT